MGIEETHCAICLQCDKASHFGKKLHLTGLLDDMLFEWDMQNPQKSDCWTFEKMGWSFSVPTSQKKLPDIVQDTEERYEKLCQYKAE